MVIINPIIIIIMRNHVQKMLIENLQYKKIQVIHCPINLTHPYTCC